MAGGADVVTIVEHDVAWAAEYMGAADELLSALADWIVAVEHIGSTAVPGLAAKPVIDIQVGVHSLEASAEIVSAMQSLGYEYVSEFETELPRRRYFRRWSGGRRSHQVHLVERADSEWWDRHVAFRDWLRAHPDDRDEYAALKRRLAEEHSHDRRAYTEAKSEFIRAIEKKAMDLRPD